MSLLLECEFARRGVEISKVVGKEIMKDQKRGFVGDVGSCVSSCYPECVAVLVHAARRMIVKVARHLSVPIVPGFTLQEAVPYGIYWRACLLESLGSSVLHKRRAHSPRLVGYDS